MAPSKTQPEGPMHEQRRITAWSSEVFVAIASLVVVLVGCAPDAGSVDPGDVSDILYGRDTTAQPQIGLFVAPDGDGRACTATLIGSRTVLVAAHCVYFTTHTEKGNYGKFQIAK